MPTRPRPPSASGPRVHLRPPQLADALLFLRAARASHRLHGPWARAPRTPTQFSQFVTRYDGRAATHAAFLVVRNDDGELAGVFSLSEIVRGAFKSAYLGYYAFAPLAGGGYMTEGLALALDVAYRRLKLHRVEVNVQPTNRRSLALVERLGFTREGFSRRYVKIGGRWRDHVRYAMLAEDWAKLRRAPGAASAKAKR
jgi:[ribosomal protein S5]-alanine N-acetyltransferase